MQEGGRTKHKVNKKKKIKKFDISSKLNSTEEKITYVKCDM